MVATPAQNQQSFETLDIQVRGLESDVVELKDSITGLEAKFDRSIASLANEVRTAVATLSSQFSERQRTPWALLIGALSVTIAIIGFVGGQALSPIMQDIKALKDTSFPREEAVFRYGINNKRLDAVESAQLVTQDRRYNELLKMNDRLENDNRELRRKP